MDKDIQELKEFMFLIFGQNKTNGVYGCSDMEIPRRIVDSFFSNNDINVGSFASESGKNATYTRAQIYIVNRIKGFTEMFAG